MNKKLSELTEIELKATAFDHLQQIQLLQNSLVEIQKEMASRYQQGLRKAKGPIEVKARLAKKD